MVLVTARGHPPRPLSALNLPRVTARSLFSLRPCRHLGLSLCPLTSPPERSHQPWDLRPVDELPAMNPRFGVAWAARPPPEGSGWRGRLPLSLS